MNDEATQLLQLGKDEMVGKEWHSLGYKFINQQGVELSLDKHPIIEAIKTSKRVKNEIVGIVHSNIRGVLWTNVSITVENRDDTQQVFMYITDVSKAMQSNIACDEIIDSIKLGTWSWDIQTDEACYSEQWASMLGYTLEELRPFTIDVWRQLVHPDDLKAYDALLQKHFSRMVEECEAVVRMRHKDGHWEWIRDIGRVTQWSESGVSLYMTGVHQNISDYKEKELRLSQKVDYERILSDISSKFISSNNIDKTILESFGQLASLNQASRVYLFMLNDDAITMSNTHEWCATGVTAQKHNLQDLPLSTFPWWIEQLSKGEVINISDVSKMVPEAKAEREILEFQGVKSILVLPIFLSKSLIGFVGFDDVATSDSWSIKDVHLLSTTASIFSYALEKQLYEKELKKNYENFRAYFDTNSDFVMILNEGGEIMEVNKRVTEELGYSNEDLLGKHVLMLHPPEVRDEAAGIVNDMIAGRTHSCPLPLLAKNGEQILVETSVSKGLWNNEKALFGISKDVSEKALSIKKFEQLFDNIPVIAALTDLATGKYIEVNKVFSEKLGFTFDEAAGFSPTDLSVMDTDTCSLIVQELSTHGFIRGLETVFYHKDGTPVEVLLSATRISLLDQNYNLKLATDISQPKQYERELYEAKIKAEESDRLKSAFLATMNHELRTPLNHIIGFSDMLPDMTEDDSIKEFSKLIHKSGLNLLSIIEDVFDLAMMDQSKINLREEDVYIRDIYLELKNILQACVAESGKSNQLRLDYKINSSIVTKRIVTDKSKIMQVVSNIIKNAVKFTHKGAIALELVLEESKMLSIVIKDTGIGIPEDKQNIIFEFFRQVDDSHTRQYEGIGIGLAISQKIADAMGGQISLKSYPDVGSEFKFTFPINFYDEQLVHSSVENEDATIPSLSGTKILLVEDDPVGMGMIETMLLPTNCTLLKAINGLEALKMMFEHPSIQLVLMDLKMPVMDGFEATKRIREQKTNLPIIALTAYSLQKDKEKAMLAGCDDILTKPVNRLMLLKKIESFLEN